MELINKEYLITDISKLEQYKEDYYIVFYNVRPFLSFYKDIDITQYNGIYKCLFYNITGNFMFFENNKNRDIDNIMNSFIVQPFIKELPSSISEEYSHSYFILKGDLEYCCNIFEMYNTSYILK